MNSFLSSDLILVRRLLDKVGLGVGVLVVPSVLAVLTGVLEALGVYLLVPMARGLVKLDYSFLAQEPFVVFAQRLVPGQEFSASFLFCALIAAIYLTFAAKNLVYYLSSVAIAKVIRDCADHTRCALIERYVSYGKLFFDKANAGHLQGLVTSTAGAVASRLSDLHILITNICVLSGYLFMMLYISVKLTALLLVGMPVLNYILSWVIKRVRAESTENIEAHLAINRQLNNILTSIALVKANNMGKPEVALFSERSRAVARQEFGMDKKILLLAPLQEVIVLGIIFVIILLMAMMVQRQGGERVPGFLVFFYVIRRAASSFGQVSHLRAIMSSLWGPLKEILHILDADAHPRVPEGSRVFPGLSTAIEFRGLVFRYGDGPAVLNGVSFIIPKGKMTAVAGSSGAGKTTLTGLLLRFYDCPQGTLLIDGEDIRSFTSDSVRDHIALVGQDTMLMNDTLRRNIEYGIRRPVLDAELDDVIRKARLFDFINSLPAGLDTVIGDRGVQLSGGEKQRVSIARALLKKSEILILDEATSALDAVTEKLIQEAVDEMIVGKTAVVIAHRLSTIRKADNIVVLDGGRVAEEGSVASLLEKKGLFFRFWQAQEFF